MSVSCFNSTSLSLLLESLSRLGALPLFVFGHCGVFWQLIRRACEATLAQFAVFLVPIVVREGRNFPELAKPHAGEGRRKFPVCLVDTGGNTVRDALGLSLELAAGRPKGILARRYDIEGGGESFVVIVVRTVAMGCCCCGR